MRRIAAVVLVLAGCGGSPAESATGSGGEGAAPCPAEFWLQPQVSEECRACYAEPVLERCGTLGVAGLPTPAGRWEDACVVVGPPVDGQCAACLSSPEAQPADSCISTWDDSDARCAATYTGDCAAAHAEYKACAADVIAGCVP